MDLDTSFKLVALGYTGNYHNTMEILEWFRNNYGIGYQKIINPKNGSTKFNLYWKDSEGRVDNIKLETFNYIHINPSPEYVRRDVIKLIIKLFASKDGEIYGPSREIFNDDNLNEWT